MANSKNKNTYKKETVKEIKTTDQFWIYEFMRTVSKIYEKLILKRILEIKKINKIDLTGSSHHGFRKKKSTETAGLVQQSICVSFHSD